MLSKVLGQTISVMLQHQKNALLPMERRPLGSTRFFRFLHPAKAAAPISSRPSERVTVSSSLHSKKASSPMMVTPAGIVTLFKLSRRAKALSAISGVGPERAKAIREELELQGGFLDELLAALTVIRSAGGEKLPTICFTGKMPEKRSYYEKLARSAGYEPVSEANSGLGLLVAMDVNENSTKLKNARKNNVKIVSLDEFMKEIVPAENNAVSQVEIGETMDLF